MYNQQNFQFLPIIDNRSRQQRKPDYRLISLSPTLSKITKAIISSRIKNFISESNIILEEQFGIQSKHFTELVEHIF